MEEPQVFASLYPSKDVCARTNEQKCAFRCQAAYVFHSAHMHPTYICSLPDEPLLRIKDVFDASDQLQRTAVIRALKDKEHMCCVKAC